MQLAFLSDIHGNLTALEAVLADLETQGPFDALGVAGDLCEGGPWPHEVLERVRALGCPVVQGNNDRYLTVDDDELRAIGKGEKAIATVAWARSQLSPDELSYLATLPFAHTYAGPHGPDILMLHANARNQETHLDPDAPLQEVARLLDGAFAEVVVFGHLHIAYVRTLPPDYPGPTRLLVDAASVGYPRDGDRRAAYAILKWDGAWQATIRRVAYDMEKVAAAYRSCGIPHANKHVKELYQASYDE